MMEDNKYSMTLFEALDVVLSGGWVQGDDFGSEIVFRLKDNAIVAYDFSNGDEWIPRITPSMRNQKFRRVYTQAGSKK